MEGLVESMSKRAEGKDNREVFGALIRLDLEGDRALRDDQVDADGDAILQITAEAGNGRPPFDRNVDLDFTADPKVS